MWLVSFCTLLYHYMSFRIVHVHMYWILILQLNMPYFELTLYNLLLVGRKGKGGPSSGKAKKAVNVAGEFRNYTSTCLSAYTYIYVQCTWILILQLNIPYFCYRHRCDGIINGVPDGNPEKSG